MNKVLFLIAMVGTIFSAGAQPKEQSRRIEGEEAHGYTITATISASNASKYLNEFIKPYGKPRKKGAYKMVKSPVIDSDTYTDELLYFKIEDKGNAVAMWAGITTTLMGKDSSKMVIKKIHKLMLSLQSHCAKSEVQRLIQESETAIEYTSKEQQKSLREQGSLKSKIEENNAEIIRLEKLLETKKFDQKVLDQKMVNSANKSDSLYVEIEKMKLVLDKHKSKLKKIN